MRKSGLLLLDNDIFVLLAGGGLLPNLLIATGFDQTQARRLLALPHLLRGKRMRKLYPPGILERTLAWCGQIHALEDVPVPKLADQLAKIEGIEPGEALLFAHAAEIDGALLATGDKRACRALGTVQGFDLAKERLVNKVICFEVALWLVLRQVGYQKLAIALTWAREANQTLRRLLPQGERTPQEEFETGLDSYLRDLAMDAGKLLFPVSELNSPAD